MIFLREILIIMMSHKKITRDFFFVFCRSSL